MNPMIGTYSLSLAVFITAATILTSLAAVRFESRQLLLVAKGGLGLMAGLFTIASIVLLTALVDGDFSVRYVQHYTEMALPIGYKLAAFWAGQEGSLLLWAWMLSIMSVLAVFTHRSSQIKPVAVLVAVLAVLGGFFAALMLYAANPFEAAEAVTADGQGLNPMLQNIGMIAHTPLLFIGYAVFAIPFALMVSALFSGTKKPLPTKPLSNSKVIDYQTPGVGQNEDMSLGEVRNWTIFSWLFLSIGIILGAQWAYVELGWGGYWAWDPVENASLLPWLTATALLHSIIVQQHRGMLKIWNAGLIAVTFILCIFGTYLTRSGVVQSVHSFGASLVGTFFLVFLTLLTVFSIGMILWQRKSLRSENPLENILGREGAFLIVNVLLSLMMLVTLVGTIFPIISGLFVTEPVSVSEPFYNKFVIPLAVVLIALMACGPLLVYGADAGKRLRNGMIIPGILAALTIAVMCLLKLNDPWALACGAIITFAMTTLLMDLGKTTSERIKNTGENILGALLRMVDSNHRRYGGQLVHVGMLMIMAGIAGSRLFSIKQDLHLTPGQKAQVGNYEIQYQSLEEIQGGNYSAVQATLLATDGRGRQSTLKPQRRFYVKSEQPAAEIALETGLREDLYTNLAGWDDNGTKVAIQVIINPLVLWIWLGGIVLSLGGIICMLPRFLPVGNDVENSSAQVATGKTNPGGKKKAASSNA